MGAAAKQAVNELVEIATGQAAPLKEIDATRKQFQKRQKVLLDQLPELPEREAADLPPAPSYAADPPEEAAAAADAAAAEDEQASAEPAGA
jgi:hypothetical protein